MPPKKIHNRKYLEKFRKKLRSNLTPAEAVLWSSLQRKQLEGRKFRRQHSIGNYIADFYCPSERIVVELDGAGHFTPEGSDAMDRIKEFPRQLSLKFPDDTRPWRKIESDGRTVYVAGDTFVFKCPTCGGGA